MCALAAVLVAAQSGSATRSAGTSVAATGPAPCATTFKRADKGTLLRVSVTCDAVGVVIVRIAFPAGTKLRSTREFFRSACQDSTPRMWNCLFRFGIPTGVALNGAVRFEQALPRRTEHAQIFYYEQVAGELNTLPHSVDVDPNDFVQTAVF